MAEELLRMEGLSKYYTSDRSVVVGLDKLSLTFERGEFVAITGESGSGKSTLAHVLSGILPHESGELYLRGEPTSHYDSGDWEIYRRDSVSFISQSYGILPGSTVMENVVSALRLSGIDRHLARQKAESILRKVELWELKGRRAAKLSSGQKQRLSIARALAKPASILIADEPTGNLDGENSARVIDLLAEAAGERLVILITHDFSEAEGAATRHIALHDGRITRDARLRQPEECPAAGNKPPVRRRRRLGGYVAALHLRARPVWTTLMLLLFGLTAFGVVAFAGTFLSAWDDTFTRAYDDSAFPNGDSRRIVVACTDGRDMTPEDEEALLAVDHVESLERYSYFRDIRYGWREDVDYQWRYSLYREEGNREGDYLQAASVTLDVEEMAFAGTIPVLADGAEFLTGGRLPRELREVVAAGDESMLGQTIPVYLHDEKNWNTSAYVCLEVTVVGVTSYGSGLYFHEELGRIFLANTLCGIVYIPSQQVEGETVLFTEDYYQWMLRKAASGRETTFPCRLPDLTVLSSQAEQVELTCVGFHEHTFKYTFELSPEMYGELAMTGQGNQISLTVEYYAYTDRVLETLHAMGYAALAPCQEGATNQVPSLAAQRQQTLWLCAIAFGAVLVLLVVVLRAMFALEMENYRLLSHIGLDCVTARRSIFWQVLCFAVCGQILGWGTLFLCREWGVSQVVQLMHYLSPLWIAVLSLLHLGASLLTGSWTVKALERQVFPQAGNVPDLDWDDVEEEVGK